MLNVLAKTCEHGFSDSEWCGQPAVDIDNSGRHLCEEHFAESRMPLVETLMTIISDVFDQISLQTRLCNGDVQNTCLSLMINLMLRDHSPEEAQAMVIRGINEGFDRIRREMEGKPNGA